MDKGMEGVEFSEAAQAQAKSNAEYVVDALLGRVRALALFYGLIGGAIGTTILYFILR